MYTIYILYSFEHDKTYTDYTTNLLTRIRSHNTPGKTDFTGKYAPWVVLYTEIIETKVEVQAREKKLKTIKGRRWIENNMAEWKEVFA